MRFLVVNASLFAGSITDGFCAYFETAAHRAFIETERLNLREDAPDVCDGTYSRPETLSRFHVQLLACDGVFIATPCHWFNMPGVLKNWLDNITRIETDLMGRARPVCIVVHAPEGGGIGTVAALALPLNLLGFTIPPWGYAYYEGGDRWAFTEVLEMPLRIRDYVDDGRIA